MFYDTLTKNLLAAAIIIIASALVGQVVKYLLNTIFRRLFAATETSLDDRILVVVKSKVTTLSIIIGFYIGISVVKQGTSLEEVTFHRSLDYFTVGLYVILVFVLTRLVSRIIETIFEWYMDEVSVKTKSNVTATVAPLTKKIVDIILLMIAAMIVLDHFGVNIGSLLVSLGVGSLAVALAAQETVANMISGFVILIDQPFRVGDRIKLPSGEEGDVMQIGLRSTRILNYDNNLVVVPNSELVKNRIINYSFPDYNTRVMVELKVAYGTDMEEARKILLMLAKENNDILKEPSPAVFFMDYGESGILLRLSARSSHFDKKFEIETNLRERIYKKFMENGIEIPLTKRVVYTQELNEVQTQKKK